ncbi:MAG: leucine-rich repeat domain-containing protein [Acidobacteriota bacterium]|nr:leucine-rich repeat domain-containing protein [Acidobacteriota bacterium]
MENFFITQIIAYIISFAASRDTEALAERRAEKLAEDLKDHEAEAAGESFEEELVRAAQTALEQKTRLGLSPGEEKLSRFFSIPDNARVLAEWLSSVGAREQERLQEMLASALAEVLADGEDVPSIIQEFFSRVQRMVFGNAALAEWLQHKSLAVLHDKVDRVVDLLESLTENIGAEAARQIAVFWLKPEKSEVSIEDLLGKQSYRARRKGAHQFTLISDQIAETLEDLYREDLRALDPQTSRVVIQRVGKTLAEASLPPAMIRDPDLEPETLRKHLFKPAGLSAEADDLYDQLLGRCCRIIVDIAANMPRQSERNLDEVLQTALAKQAETILEEIKRLKQASADRDEARFEETYRDAVARNLDRIVLFGTDDNRSKRYQLSVAYVSLTMEQEIESPDEDDEEEKSTSTEIFEVEELLAKESRLMIRGGPGSGKTTLLQWFAVKLARAELKTGPLAPWNNHLPIFLRFRDVNELPTPESFLKTTVPMIAEQKPEGWVYKQLKEGRAILLLDGLDEWSGSTEDAGVWLEDLTITFPDCRFLITSRIHAADSFAYWLDRLKVEEAGLRDMRLDDIEQFIDHWHKAMQREINDSAERDSLPVLAEDLKQVVHENDALRKLATNPLLCSMICALFRSRCKDLPTDRIELYKACRAMFYRRDSERKISLEGYPSLTDDQKNRLLGALALWMVRNTKTKAKEETVDRRFEGRLKAMDVNAAASDVRRFFVERVGLLRRPSPGLVDFPHKTFQELYAAEEALDNEEIGSLVANAEKEAWREVIILASGLARPVEGIELIEGLLRRAGRGEDKKRYFILLTAACQKMAREKSQEVRDKVGKALIAVVHPQLVKDAKELAEADELALPYLTFNKYLNQKEQKARVRTLALIGSARAYRTLRMYFDEKRPGVIAEIANSSKMVHDLGFYESQVLMKLKKLYLRYSRTDLKFLTAFSNLTLLELDWIGNVTDLSPLTGLNQLTTLHLKSFYYFTNLSSLTGWTHSFKLTYLNFLTGLTQLTELNLEQCHGVTDLSPLAGLTQLTSLDLHGCSNVTDLSPLAGLTQLTSLNLGNCSEVKDLSPLASLTQLTKLNLRCCSTVKDLSPLAGLTQLTELNLTFCSKVTDLSPLAGLTQLTSLDLSYCSKVTDLSPLAGLAQLKDLYLQWVLINRTPLAHLKSLTIH